MVEHRFAIEQLEQDATEPALDKKGGGRAQVCDRAIGTPRIRSVLPIIHIVVEHRFAIEQLEPETMDTSPKFQTVVEHRFAIEQLEPGGSRRSER